MCLCDYCIAFVTDAMSSNVALLTEYMFNLDVCVDLTYACDSKLGLILMLKKLVDEFKMLPFIN